MSMRFTQSVIVIAAALLLLSGCVAPRGVEAPSAVALLGSRPEETKVPIRSFKIESYDRDFELKSPTVLMASEKRVVLYPKQAREFILQDIRDYMASRFRIDERSGIHIELKLEQAYFYWLWYDNPAGIIPVVGIFTTIADGTKPAPIVFTAEVKAEVKSENTKTPEIGIFIRRTEMVTGFSLSGTKFREVYGREILEVRKELFDRLDSQVLALWKDGRFVGSQVSPRSTAEASLKSEIARCDAALADHKISQEEHANLVRALKARYLEDGQSKSP